MTRQRTVVKTDEQGIPRVEPPSPLDSQSLYGNSFLLQMYGFDGTDSLFDPYSDLTGPSPYEMEQRRAQAELDPNFRELDKEEQDKILERSGPGYGFAATRIGRHYGAQTEIPGLKEAERNQVLDLSTEEGRLGALSGMRQNGNPMDPNGAMRCGASSMVGGALYGGGKQGLQTLLDAMAADRQKAGLPPLGGKELEAVKKKLADPSAQLTMGDLDTLQSATYDHFRAGKDGVNGRAMKDFIQNHPGMKSMFAAKDMGLDGIDLSGDGTSEHLVLGIGRDRAGNRKMVYDPQARQAKEGWGDYMDPEKVDAIRSAEKAKRKADYDALTKKFDENESAWFFKDEHFDYVAEMDKIDAEVEAQVRAQQYAYKHDSQLVVDPGELRDYGQATDYRVGAKGIEEHDAQTKATPGKRPGY